MVTSNRTIAIIPARGGSKGIKHKNIQLLGDKPLIAHTIEQALAAESVNDVYVTTDCPEIANVSEQFGASVIHRSDELASDTATSEVALLDAMMQIQSKGKRIELVVFLQCTSPFRHATDIDNAVGVLLNEEADSLLSVVPNHRFLWQQDVCGASSINYDYTARPRRQDMALQYQENGSIYLFKPWVIEQLNNRLGGKIALYVMEQASEIDIDTEWDIMLARHMMAALVDEM